jgi:hypothetical protein
MAQEMGQKLEIEAAVQVRSLLRALCVRSAGDRIEEAAKDQQAAVRRGELVRLGIPNRSSGAFFHESGQFFLNKRKNFLRFATIRFWRNCSSNL